MRCVFKLVTLEDAIRIPPERFGEEIDTVGYEQLKMKYDGMVDESLGYVIGVTEIKVNPFGKMASFVTDNDEVIQDLSMKLNDLANIQGYNLEQKANFILRFVQTNIDYSEDDDTKGCVEHWRFPVETLVEQEGDCEDTSTLYAAILKNLEYDLALLFYSWEEDDENIGHLAVGINIPGDHGGYVTDENDVKYYYWVA